MDMHMHMHMDMDMHMHMHMERTWNMERRAWSVGGFFGRIWG